MACLTRPYFLFWASFVVLACVFHFFPQIDVAFSGLFFHNHAFLLNRESPLLWWSYRALPVVGDVFFILLLVFFVLSFFKNTIFKKQRIFLAFLLTSALLGPVLLTEGIKTFSGRARPYNTTLFQGQMPFTPAFSKATFCAKNCSFVSGHTSSASFIFGFFWFLPKAKRRFYFCFCAAFVVAVALSRIIPGAHFLSDCVFGFFTTIFSFLFTETIFKMMKLNIHAKNPRST